MPFTGGAQAQDEAQRAGRQAGLVRVRHDRGIEEGRGFHGVLGDEVRPDQELALLRRLAVGQQKMTDLAVALEQELAYLAVPAGELGQDFAEQDRDLLFRKRHDAGDDLHALGADRAVVRIAQRVDGIGGHVEGAQQDPRLVGLQYRADAAYGDRFTGHRRNDRKEILAADGSVSTASAARARAG